MQKIEIHKFRMTVRNGKMAVALHLCNLQMQLPEHGGTSKLPQSVNISISHSIRDAESVPVESYCEPENFKVKVSFVNF